MLGDEHKATVDGYARSVLEAWASDGRPMAEFADKAGLTPQAVSQIRLGQWGVGMKGLRGFSHALGVSLSDFEERALAWHAAGRPPLGPEALTGAQGGGK
jgi:transcriptional regulator with XRE-family HTH domain